MQSVVKKHSDQVKPSLIIVNYNAGDLLLQCIDSALSQVSEIFVVDNASTDASIATLAANAGAAHTVSVIQNNRNLGFAAACNIGIKSATSDRLLFLNPDCRLGKGSVTKLLGALEVEPSVGMAGGLLVSPNGVEQGGGRRAIPTPWRAFVRAFGLYRLARRWPQLFFDYHLTEQPLPGHPVEVEAISGACILVKREALEDVGPWDEGYFLHCEDLDWCMRFRQRGWKIMFVPDARVVHEQGACSRSRPLFVEWHKHRGMFRFYRKFFKHDYPGPLMALVAVGVWLRFGLVVAYKSVARFTNF